MLPSNNRFANLKTILFDLDGTLINTHAVFRMHIDRMNDLIVSDGNKMELVSEAMSLYLREAYQEVYVNPNKLWPFVIEHLQTDFGFSKAILEELLKYSADIYFEVPDVFEGVPDVLKELKKKYRIGIVTHAERKWTDFKVASTDLKRYFDFVAIVSVDKHKDKGDWITAAKENGIDIATAMVVGDNIKGDVIAAYEAGFAYQVLMSPTTNWSVYSEGEIPDSVIRLEGVKGLYDLFGIPHSDTEIQGEK